MVECLSLGDSLVGRTADSGSASPGSNPGPPAYTTLFGLNRAVCYTAGKDQSVVQS